MQGELGFTSSPPGGQLSKAGLNLQLVVETEQLPGIPPGANLKNPRGDLGGQKNTDPQWKQMKTEI
jgi:hypothetical protein